MGQLCAKPRTSDEKPAACPAAQSERCVELDSSLPAVKGRPGGLQTQHVPPELQPSDAASSELDVVVQHLRETNYSVTGSAPELLQQWDHDHRVVLDSIEAAIQVAAPAYIQQLQRCCTQSLVLLQQKESCKACCAVRAMKH